jgi:hypothetical protein
MSDAERPWYVHDAPKPAPRQPKPGELLFEFVREQDHRHFRCELRFHGESAGWEAQYLADGELLLCHGGFSTRAAAEAWATTMRSTIERYL